jgi:hypothetical protein
MTLPRRRALRHGYHALPLLQFAKRPRLPASVPPTDWRAAHLQSRGMPAISARAYLDDLDQMGEPK